MKLFRRTPPTTPAPPVQPPIWHVPREMLMASERANWLKEYELLDKIQNESALSASQYQRLGELTKLLWPPPAPPEHNPMNGIRRVPGGHGFPISDQRNVDVGTDRH